MISKNFQIIINFLRCHSSYYGGPYGHCPVWELSTRADRILELPQQEKDIDHQRSIYSYVRLKCYSKFSEKCFSYFDHRTK